MKWESTWNKATSQCASCSLIRVVSHISLSRPTVRNYSAVEEKYNLYKLCFFFSRFKMLIFCCGKKDSDIFCWDIRNPGKLLQVFKRDVKTNQRMYFDLYNETKTSSSESVSTTSECKYLASGNHDGSVRVWRADEFDGSVESEPLLASFKAHEDCTNGIRFPKSISLKIFLLLK